MATRTHDYTARLVWEGNTGQGTARYTTYGRQYRITIAGKPDLLGSADPMFRGDPTMHNPEDHFLAAISGCHMLSYLAICARNGVRVIAYEDDVQGRLALETGGGGRFEEVRLRPTVTIDDQDRAELAAQLHEAAHELCFIASSCSVPIRHEPTVRVAAAIADGRP
jgi:organic hydroperoxide reductase OsmC/OhrA